MTGRKKHRLMRRIKAVHLIIRRDTLTRTIENHSPIINSIAFFYRRAACH